MVTGLNDAVLTLTTTYIISPQLQEHELVLKTLEPVEATRTCFRLIGGVLVERTVAEVRPAVAANAENLRLVRFLVIILVS